MDTKLTVDEIELAIVNSGIFNKRSDIIVPNVSWGMRFTRLERARPRTLRGMERV